MARLSAPTSELRVSFLAAMAEFRAEGRGGPDDRTLIGWETVEFGSLWAPPDQRGDKLRFWVPTRP